MTDVFQAFQPLEETIRTGGPNARMAVLTFYFERRLKGELGIATTFMSWAQHRLPPDDNARVVKAMLLIC